MAVTSPHRESTTGYSTLLSNSTGGGDGVYLYTTSGGYPSNSYNSTNYWVDVVFSTTVTPAVISTTPAAGSTEVSTSSPNITATFNEAVQSGSISFVLTDSGGNTVPTSLSYNTTTNTATFTPTVALTGGKTYTATVSGAQDLANDVMSAPYSWTFTTGAVNTFTQTTVVDFSSGTQSNTTVDPTTGGVTLASTVSDDFSEGVLSSAWTTDSWTPAGGGPTSVTLSGGVLSVGGAEVLLTTTIPDGVGVEGSVNFAAAPYQHFGMATDLSTATGNSWAIFSTGGTNDTLFARVNSSGTMQDVSLGALPSGFHDYKIQPVAGGIQFSVDGVALATINLTIPSGTLLTIAMSSFNGAPQPALQVDWVRSLSYVSSGTFTSSVFDAGSDVNWGDVAWTANPPAGTTITVLTSSSTDGTNWSDWSTVTNGGTITSPNGRYLRYQVLLTTTDPTVTPTLSNISFTWG